MTGARERGGLYESIYEVVRGIPRGRVATYGQVARLAGIAPHWRLVGYALSALPAGSPVPWHRVVRRDGAIAERSRPAWARIQAERLRAEGVRLTDGRVDLDSVGWRPRNPLPRRALSARLPPGAPGRRRLPVRFAPPAASPK